ncbi:hypothetical protein SODALDRAFT_335024 [Sodiomyces alkalinus F11]|uniref:Fungal calcium binding protein domain-containing protein n=1 Tax=Sodiomyces alkalinus (strain CBS 110278 / VKM F-3762 / F11) TaxID=1314773 RepID=A0A3N2PQN3_SODAK|nr:hypothetical protein SODALDRAFT_335024 [Sodiomyces alkalinus F11]ROT36822.1 hypothetical protein SODALDRAFT_335024 [Sodiomyces alkalinus F11]
MKASMVFLSALAELAAATPAVHKRQGDEISFEDIDLQSLIEQLERAGIDTANVQPNPEQSNCARCVDSCSDAGDAFNFACKVVKCGIQVSRALDRGACCLQA